MDILEVEDIIPASSEQIYNDWLSSSGHSNMTGADAEINDEPRASFSAWDGYISGTNLQLEKNKRIFQSWRTLEFPENAPDSVLEVTLEPLSDSETKVIITQSNLPDGDGPKYTDGWNDYYFAPMKEYYLNL
ncbi:MAG: SRPBCC domain-containing protein [Crocinitomicaceae bacterium]